jgi:hypothetical protein
VLVKACECEDWSGFLRRRRSGHNPEWNADAAETTEAAAPETAFGFILCTVTIVVAGLSRAQAADTVLTLACQGTTTSGVEDAKPEPVSMGLIVNFTNRTVQGFGSPGVIDYPVKITAWNEVTVAFLGSEDKYRSSIRGSIDRVTGDVEATSMVTDAKTGNIVASTSYALKCRPAQRMF